MIIGNRNLFIGVYPNTVFLRIQRVVVSLRLGSLRLSFSERNKLGYFLRIPLGFGNRILFYYERK